MVFVRKAMAEDEAVVIDLLKELRAASEMPSDSSDNWPKMAVTFQEVIRDEALGTVLLAEEESDAIGLLTLSYPTAMWCGGIYTCIEEFVVREQARGKGVGGKLLETAFAEAKTKDCEEIQVNRPSQLGYPVYLRHGIHDMGKHLKLKLRRQSA